MIGAGARHDVDRDAAEIVGLSPAAMRNTWHHVAGKFFPIECTLSHRRLDPSRQDRVDSNPIARYGITVNAILPGWIETAMTERAFNWEKFAGNVMPRIPHRRWGQPDDFGGIAVYIMSSASAYHTGDTFLIDGGYNKF